jgi:hypothetical protein
MHCDAIYFCRWLPVFGVTCCIQLEGTKNIQHIPLLTCEVHNFPFHHYKNNLFSFFLFCTNIHIHLNIILYIQVLDLKLSSQITIMTSFVTVFLNTSGQVLGTTVTQMMAFSSQHPVIHQHYPFAR